MKTQQSNTTPRTQRLPAPVPGQTVTIPLELLPIYLAAHRLEPMDRGEVRTIELAKKVNKPDGVVWVKRSE